MLGLHQVDGTDLRLRPCIRLWPGFSLRYRLPEGDAGYAITVDNPEGCTARVGGGDDRWPARHDRSRRSLHPLFHDGRLHRVTVTLGTGRDGFQGSGSSPGVMV